MNFAIIEFLLTPAPRSVRWLENITRHPKENAMKIRDLMISDPITVTHRASIQEAIQVMKTNSIRHLPVVSRGNILKGFVTLSDLKQGLIPSMIGDLALTDLMIKQPITVSPEDDVEIAAQLIYKYKIGGMPVTESNRLVGIITESDILRAFISMMGILSASSRIDVIVEDEPGSFKKAFQVIQDNGGDIMNVAMTAQQGGKRTYYFRLFSCKTDVIEKALAAEGFSVLAAMD